MARPSGHLEELRRDPIALMRRVRDECGDVGRFDLAGRPVILLSGAGANEYFFRAPDEDLDQAGAYPFMTPIFGEGVVFDASPERRREALHNQALRGDMMRGHAQTIAAEVDRMVAGWADAGEIDLLDWFAELTIYTSSACLIGPSSATSSTGGSRICITTWSAARMRWRSSTRTRRSRASAAGTRPARGWSSLCVTSWPGGRRRARPTAVTGTCSTC